MDVAEAFGLVLRRLRQEAGLTQEALGFAAGLQRNYISLLELGQRQPSLTTILSLARGMDTDAAAMVGLVEAELGHPAAGSPAGGRVSPTTEPTATRRHGDGRKR